ncbi:hypothetical protein [Hyphococcus sp.]|uniref:hypothetical protein n=1 Tax=Hyphococcus sp. TaxID=2038636 RepID=UPI0035C6E5CF
MRDLNLAERGGEEQTGLTSGVRLVVTDRWLGETEAGMAESAPAGTVNENPFRLKQGVQLGL